MKSFSFILALCSLLALASTIAASYVPDRRFARPGFIKRQESATPTEPSNTSEQPSKTSSATNSGESESAKSSNTESGSSKSGSNTRSSGSQTAKSKSTSIDPRSPPGGVQMVTPAPTAGSTYVAIGQYATFAWNYTSLLVTPSAVDIVAYCSKNMHSYTIASNQTVANATGSVVWDTQVYQTQDVPLLTEIYALMIYDSESNPSAIPGPGRLGNQNPFRFGVYAPQPYTPGVGECVTCVNNGAVSATQQQAILFMLGMITVTICSFGWFASGFGLLA